MHDSKQSFGIFVLVAILTGALAAQPASVTIDAARTGPPITRLMFGFYGASHHSGLGRNVG